MTTTSETQSAAEALPTITNSSERLESWLSMHRTEVVADHGVRSSRFLIARDPASSSHHSSISIDHYAGEGGYEHRSSVLYVSNAVSIRAQQLDDGSSALVVSVPGGDASIYLPLSLDQIMEAIQAERIANA